jgi:hypothetical protein
MQKWCKVVFWCAFFFLTPVANSYGELSSEELLQILIEKGIITQDDIEKADESRKEKKEIAEEKEEVVLKAARYPKSMNFKGRVQARYTAMENGDLSKVTPQKVFETSEFDGFVLRRVRLRWFGNVTDQWKYHVQVSVDGDHNDDKVNPSLPDYELRKTDVGVMLQDAYFIYDLHPYFNVTVGQFKSRFSPSYLVAGPVLPLCERPLVIDLLARKREIGMSIESALEGQGQLDGRGPTAKLYDKPIFYAVGLYNGNGFNKMRNDNENLMVTGMLVYRPSPYINFGVSYAYDEVGYDYETTVLGLAELSEDGDYYVFPVTDRIASRNLHIWDFNSALDLEPFHVQVEYVQADGNDVSRAYGYGIQGQYDLFDNFQLTARYDEFDPNVNVDNSFDSRWYTLGCNWFIHGQDIKWQINYTFREETHGEDVDNDILITHFQVLF